MGGRLPIERLVREPEPDAETPLVTRVGRTVGKGVVTAVASTLPAALRMGDEPSVLRALEQWLVLSAVSTPLAIATVLVIRRARIGLNVLAGDRGSLLALGVLWWSIIELSLLSVFGAVLRKTTHQHALAGVTFAGFAVVTGIVVALFAARTTGLLARGGLRAQRNALLAAGAAAFIVVMVVGVRTSRAEGLHTAAALVDLLALAVTATVASSRAFDRYRPLAIGGVPAAILVLMIGLTTLRFDPKLQDSLTETAPVHAAIIDLLRSP
jgi:hypothetical protein